MRRDRPRNSVADSAGGQLMPNEATTTVCFRVQLDERDLLESVSHFANKTLSAFARDVLMAAAMDMVKEFGSEVIMQADRDYEKQRATKANTRLKSRLKGIETLHEPSREAN